MNWIGLKTLYVKEIERMFAVPMQTILSPALTTTLYFVVFGSAIGSAIGSVGEISYQQFIVPGLIMMTILSDSLSASSSGMYFPRFLGTIYELLSAPLSYFEITLGFVGAAITRAMLVGTIIYLVALLFTPVPIVHPFFALVFAVLTSASFALFGLIIGIWADNFEKLSLFPVMIITPMSFLGGVFYSLEMLPPFWQTVSLFNPIVYMISGLRWSFFGVSDVSPFISFMLIGLFLALCIGALTYIFKTGWRLKS